MASSRWPGWWLAWLTSGASAATILATGVAGTVAGAMSMAAGGMSSVRTQADTEAADLAMEKRELRDNPHSELEELAAIYRHRGLEPALARQVAEQLTAHDALGARDELGITDTLRARPLQAALASAGAFTCGAALPVLALLAPVDKVALMTTASTLLGLCLTGAVAAQAAAPRRYAAQCVDVLGCTGNGAAAGVGRLFGAQVT